MTNYLKVLTNELKSAQLIIKILSEKCNGERKILGTSSFCDNNNSKTVNLIELKNRSAWTEIR
jgi:hypothetical protein